jgi:hypothetical protein
VLLFFSCTEISRPLWEGQGERREGGREGCRSQSKGRERREPGKEEGHLKIHTGQRREGEEEGFFREGEEKGGRKERIQRGGRGKRDDSEGRKLIRVRTWNGGHEEGERDEDREGVKEERGGGGTLKMEQ